MGASHGQLPRPNMERSGIIRNGTPEGTARLRRSTYVLPSPLVACNDRRVPLRSAADWPTTALPQSMLRDNRHSLTAPPPFRERHHGPGAVPV